MLAYNYGLQIRPTNTNKITDNWNSSFIGALAVGFGSSVSVLLNPADVRGYVPCCSL